MNPAHSNKSTHNFRQL